MLKTLKLAGMAGLMAVTVGLAGCANIQKDAATVTETKGDIAATLETVGTFSTFLKAADAAGVTDILKGEEPITVFAPTDDAFTKLPPGTMRQLMAPANKAQLRAVVLNHIVTVPMMTDYFINGVRDVKTVAGKDVEVNALRPDQGIFFGKARVTKPNIEATNGVVHAIDDVVLP